MSESPWAGQPAAFYPGYPPPADEPTQARWYAHWWLWLLAAVVIVAVVVGVVLAIRPAFSLEKKLADAIRAKGDTVTAVSCPPGADSSAGSATTCSATVNGVPQKLSVRFRGDKNFVATYLTP